MIPGRERYRKLNTALRHAFGGKVYRVGVVGGFTCPNRDGTLGRGGCVFCNPASSAPLNHEDGMSLGEQLERGCAYVRRRHRVERFIPYFQDGTATYGDVRRLEALLREALAYPGAVGLALATRPDCLAPPVLDLLAELAAETLLWVELGVQSVHDETLARIDRGHDQACTERAVAALRRRGISVVAHVILGLPGEGRDHLEATAAFLERAGVEGVKLHNLHVVEGTKLAASYRAGAYAPMTMALYAELAVFVLERLPQGVLVHRLTGEAPRRLTLAPAWSVNKLAVMNTVERTLEERDSWQGKALGAPLEGLALPLEQTTGD